MSIPTAVSLRALDEGIPVRLDTHRATGLEEGVICRRHSNITDVNPPETCSARPASLQLCDGVFQVGHGHCVFTSQLEDLELKVGL